LASDVDSHRGVARNDFRAAKPPPSGAKKTDDQIKTQSESFALPAEVSGLVHSSSAFKKTAQQPNAGIALEKPPPPVDEAKFSLNQPAQLIEIRLMY
jgi:hypothetical protein